MAIAESSPTVITDELYRGIWTCNNPNLPDIEEHVLGEGDADSLEEFSTMFTAHYHGTCLECEESSDTYEGSLARVEHIENGTVVERIPPETLIYEYGLEDPYGEFTE